MSRLAAMCLIVAASLPAQAPTGWQKGKGFGWSYGRQDEIGALNAVSQPAQILAALKGITIGRVFDLGVRIDRTSYKWPGHSPTEVLRFRSPDGVKRGRDVAAFNDNKKGIVLAQLRAVYQRQRGHADRRSRTHHPRREQPLVGTF